MKNILSIISSHNKQLLKSNTTTLTYNIYQAPITSDKDRLLVISRRMGGTIGQRTNITKHHIKTDTGITLKTLTIKEMIKICMAIKRTKRITVYRMEHVKNN